MQLRRFARFAAQTVFIGTILVTVVLAGVWGSEHIPLWITGPFLIALVMGIAWRETRP